MGKTGASFRMDMSRLANAVSRAAGLMGESRNLAEAVGEVLVASIRKRFKDETDPEGNRWKESARAESEGGQTLTETAGLKNSIAYEASPTMVVVGTNKEYAAIHQFGGEIKPKSAPKLKFQVGGKWVSASKVTMPARPFIGINEEDMEEARETMLSCMKRAFRTGS
jgi:phage virion morphogenesis protein